MIGDLCRRDGKSLRKYSCGDTVLGLRVIAHFARLTKDAAKPDMACRGIHRLGMACGRAVASAVIRRTEMRAAFQHLPRDPAFLRDNQYCAAS